MIKDLKETTPVKGVHYIKNTTHEAYNNQINNA